MAKTYYTYKDSGIAWIGNIPSEWKIVRIKDEYSFQTGATPPTGNESYFDGDNIWVSIADMKEKVIIDSKKKVSNSGIDICNMSIAPKGSLLYSFKLSVGNVAFAGKDLYTNEAIASFSPNAGYLPFLYYTAPQFVVYNSNTNIYGANILNQELIKNALVPFPPLSEQQAIATYLDEKCGEIDSLISLQEEMISELQAYKQSVITEAVTKGLDPNVPMKDSGVEWIGMIPEGWNICKLKFLCSSIKDGSHFSPTTTEEGFPYITAADVHGKGLDYANAKKISEKDYNDLVQSGCKAEKDDILLVKDGATTGRVGMKIENNPCVLLSSVAMLRVNTKAYPTYLMYMVSSDLLQQQISIAMAGSAMPRITLTKLNTFIALEVPLSEQQAIASYLDEKTSQIDSLIAIKQEKITELKDYKKSIIYEYVTGKKKV